jgi:hypothetical protein
MPETCSREEGELGYFGLRMARLEPRRPGGRGEGELVRWAPDVA